MIRNLTAIIIAMIISFFRLANPVYADPNSVNLLPSDLGVEQIDYTSFYTESNLGINSFLNELVHKAQVTLRIATNSFLACYPLRGISETVSHYVDRLPPFYPPFGKVFGRGVTRSKVKNNSFFSQTRFLVYS